MNANILCFDFGLARIGVAMTDTETQIIHPLTTIHCSNHQINYPKIEELLVQWKPQQVVIGYPSDDSPKVLLYKINELINYFGEKSIPVTKIDEAYSSVEAKNILRQQRQANFRSRISKGDIDKIAASLILETWLNIQK